MLERGFNALQGCKLRLAPVSMDLALQVRGISPLICKSAFLAHAGTQLNPHTPHMATFSRSGYSPPSLSKSLKNQQPRSHESA